MKKIIISILLATPVLSYALPLTSHDFKSLARKAYNRGQHEGILGKYFDEDHRSPNAFVAPFKKALVTAHLDIRLTDKGLATFKQVFNQECLKYNLLAQPFSNDELEPITKKLVQLLSIHTPHKTIRHSLGRSVR